MCINLEFTSQNVSGNMTCFILSFELVLLSICKANWEDYTVVWRLYRTQVATKLFAMNLQTNNFWGLGAVWWGFEILNIVNLGFLLIVCVFTNKKAFIIWNPKILEMVWDFIVEINVVVEVTNWSLYVSNLVQNSKFIMFPMSDLKCTCLSLSSCSNFEPW